MKTATPGSIALSLLAALTAIPSSAAEPSRLPPLLASGPVSDVPVDVQLLRWHMLDADVNSLTFRNMDRLFTTRKVGRSGSVWELPRSDHALDFTYKHKGEVLTPDQFRDRTFTSALLIMKNGKIVYENYRGNSTPQDRFMGWSMTKSITSLLIGCALAEHRIGSLDDDIATYLPELKGGAYAGVTIRQILEMRSGVDWDENYDFSHHPGPAASDHINALVKNIQRFADPARTIGRKHAPGSEFAYKTIDTAVLGWLIERVSGTSVAAYTARHLWEPLGAEQDGYYIMDGQPGVGREFSGAGFNAGLRDYARIGAMMLAGGKANGHQIVSPEWTRESTAKRSVASGPLGYAMQWWTIGDHGAYSAIGLAGQYIFVDPTTQTVVVKLSHFFPPENDEAAGETIAFLLAASAWNPR